MNIQEFYDTTFDNVEDDALAYFLEPPQKWAIIKDCGAWPCSGPKNLYFSFKRNNYIGIRPSYGADNLYIIPDTPGFSEYVPDCVQQPNMNAWTCQ